MASQAPIGPRLRAARLAKGLTLESVAVQVGVSQGFISRLERDQVSPSVATLIALCEAISLPIGGLFEAPATQIVRAGEGAPINFGGEGATEVLVTPGTEANLQVIHSLVEPGGSAGPDLYGLDCDVEFVYVIRGVLQIVVGIDEHRLEQGDAMTFSGRDPHRWFNASSSELCEVMWVMAPAP